MRTARNLAPLESIPKHQIYFVVDRIHVGRSYLDVARIVWKRTANRHKRSKAAVWPRAQRRLALYVALTRHRLNRELYARVMGGSF